MYLYNLEKNYSSSIFFVSYSKEIVLDSSETTKSSFINSLKNSDCPTDPYPHWLLENVFSEKTVDDIINLPIAVPRMDYSVGRRENNNEKRGYFDVDRRAEFPVCGIIADAMQSPEVIKQIEETCGVDLGGTYLRIEYTQDSPGFWLEPHTDIGVKKFTMLIYLSKDDDASNWGTSIYKDADTFIGDTPYESNHALIFVPSPTTWHGYKKRPMTGLRKNLIVNYVTDEWRAREELAFPDSPI